MVVFFEDALNFNINGRAADLCLYPVIVRYENRDSGESKFPCFIDCRYNLRLLML